MQVASLEALVLPRVHLPNGRKAQRWVIIRKKRRNSRKQQYDSFEPGPSPTHRARLKCDSVRKPARRLRHSFPALEYFAKSAVSPFYVILTNPHSSAGHHPDGPARAPPFLCLQRPREHRDGRLQRSARASGPRLWGAAARAIGSARCPQVRAAARHRPPGHGSGVPRAEREGRTSTWCS
jgi:hypothetical protein